MDQQNYSNDPTRLVPQKKAPAKAPMHPAMKQASEAWMKNHGAKFQANCGRFGKKCK